MCDGSTKACPPDAYSCGISGTVLYYRDQTLNGNTGGEPSAKAVPGVSVQRTQDTTMDTRVTDLAGAYAFTNLLGSMSVATLLRRDEPPWAPDRKAAISSTDAALIAFVAVGRDTFSPNQQIAGDVTGNGTISALDASNVARYAVELVNHFPVASASDWKFLRCDTYSSGCIDPFYAFTPLTPPPAVANFYAVLYGDVTGNWTAPTGGGGGGAGIFAASGGSTSLEEQAAAARDRAIAERLRQDGRAKTMERRPDAGPAVLSLIGWKALRAGEQRQLTVDLRSANGIFGLDLTLEYDAMRVKVVSIESAGIGAGLSLARADGSGESRIAAYGLLPLSGSGPVLKITVEALRDTGRRASPAIGGVANEGAIPLRVRGSS
jgi:hypothetical protein